MLLGLLVSLAGLAHGAELIPKVGLGLPNLLNAHLELRQPLWAVEIGAGMGLLPPGFELAVRGRPPRTCWGCGGPNEASLAFGAFFMALPLTPGAAVLAGPEVDFSYVHRWDRGPGLLLGARAGAGITTELGTEWDASHLEPAVNLVVQAGLVFGG